MVKSKYDKPTLMSDQDLLIYYIKIGDEENIKKYEDKLGIKTRNQKGGKVKKMLGGRVYAPRKANVL